MKENKTKRVILRITESQFEKLMDHVIEEQITISEIIREAVTDKLNSMNKNDQE